MGAIFNIVKFPDGWELWQEYSKDHRYYTQHACLPYALCRAVYTERGLECNICHELVPDGVIAIKEFLNMGLTKDAHNVHVSGVILE